LRAGLVPLVFQSRPRMRRLLSELLKLNLGGHGVRVFLHWPVIIDGGERVVVGDDVAIGAFVHIWGGGGVTIGDRVLIASHTAITSLSHDYSGERIYGTQQQAPIVIEDDVWIGAHSVILPGVQIGKGAVVGAGSVVTKNVPSRSIVCGAPARIVKYRPAAIDVATDQT
jgi:maltose O-acetyltransferase